MGINVVCQHWLAVAGKELDKCCFSLPCSTNKEKGANGKCKCFAKRNVMLCTLWQKQGMVPFVKYAKHLGSLLETSDVAIVVSHIIVMRHVKETIGVLINIIININRVIFSFLMTQ